MFSEYGVLIDPFLLNRPNAGQKGSRNSPFEELLRPDRLTTEEKVKLMASVWETDGLAPALAAVELPKSTWYYHRQHRVSYEEKYAHLRPLSEKIAREHPAYGIQRITAELRDTYDLAINHKVVQRLLQSWDLALLRSVRVPKPSRVRQVIVTSGERANLVAQMEQIGLFEVAHTDLAELVYADGSRKAYLMPIIGHVCKMAYGRAVGPQDNTVLALEAWEAAKATFQELVIPMLAWSCIMTRMLSIRVTTGSANCYAEIGCVSPMP